MVDDGGAMEGKPGGTLSAVKRYNCVNCGSFFFNLGISLLGRMNKRGSEFSFVENIFTILLHMSRHSTGYIPVSLIRKYTTKKIHHIYNKSILIVKCNVLFINLKPHFNINLQIQNNGFSERDFRDSASSCELRKYLPKS